MMPYDDFLKSAKLHRYDVEILMHHYACSFEQVTHRLTNLQRPGNVGVPFHFLKQILQEMFLKGFLFQEFIFPDTEDHVQDGMFILHF